MKTLSRKQEAEQLQGEIVHLRIAANVINKNMTFSKLPERDHILHSIKIKSSRLQNIKNPSEAVSYNYINILQ